MINLDVKSNLAKLIATENISIQHNKVQTASFDVKNRVLTLPIFKEKSGDVYDMLIAHECAHALFTPYKEWENIDNAELRSYVNVLEDTRIDLLIQDKFPGVVRNYENGFDILEKKDFFGLWGKDLNKDLMIIDKINLRSKSLQRLPIEFDAEGQEWLTKVDALKTFDDVVALAQEMLDWQKEQVEQMKKLPDFHKLPMAQNYNQVDEDDFDDEDDNVGYGADENSDEQDEKNDFNNFGDQKADDEKDTQQSGPTEQSDEKKEEEKDQGAPTQHSKGADGGVKSDTPLKAITDESFKEKSHELLDEKSHGYIYGNMPEPNLKSIITHKEFLDDMKKCANGGSEKYNEWLKQHFNKFKNENKKTVSYLVKEFEMKKAATSYARASQDKTGVIDPLKLPNYKFSEDIFKRMTILPDGKNHGFIMLLDWSGSMSDCLKNTIEQLLNLVEFVRKVNIPFEVYFFTSERRHFDDNQGEPSFNHKSGDWMFDNFNLVNCMSHRQTKKQLDETMMYMFHMAEYYNSNYVYHRDWNDDLQMARYDSWGIPRQYNLGNTPLNEALIFADKLVPMFIKKYGIEKFTFITLTDGGANSTRGKIKGLENADMYSDENYRKTPIYKMGKKSLIGSSYNLTPKILKAIKLKYGANVIGFYIIKRVKKWDIEKYIDAKDYYDRERKYVAARKQMTKDKALAVNADGYNKFFILDGKKMKVENFDMSEASVKKGTPSEFKRIFGKAMQDRLVSRVVLNKFIEEVA